MSEDSRFLLEFDKLKAGVKLVFGSEKISFESIPNPMSSLHGNQSDELHEPAPGTFTTPQRKAP